MGTIIETWDSAPRPGLEPDEVTTEPVTVIVRLGGGRHQLAVMAMEGAPKESPFAVGRLRGGGYMGTAVELEVTCLPDFTDLPVFIERIATEPDLHIPTDLSVQPTATATRERIELPSARPTATLTPTPAPRELPTRRGP
jgi:hypothetical protein